MTPAAGAGDQTIRRSGIGGSDIAALAGVSRWSTAMDKWQEKLGMSAPLVETERMRWGTLLEGTVAKEYSYRTGRKVRQAPTTLDPVTGLRARVIRYSADKPWRMAHVDRLTSYPTDIERGVRRGLEVKTADHFSAADFGEQGSDQVPPDYLLQCAWYMGVTGYDVWDLTVLIGGNKFGTYTIERDQELIDQLWTIGDEFWLTNVLGKVPPPIDGSESSRRFLEGKHGDPAAEIEMTDDLLALAHRHANIAAAIKVSKLELDLVGNKIREAMGAGGKAARDNAKITWAVVSTRRLDTKALAEKLPDVIAPFYTTSEEHRLTVTVREATT